MRAPSSAKASLMPPKASAPKDSSTNLGFKGIARGLRANYISDSSTNPVTSIHR